MVEVEEVNVVEEEPKTVEKVNSNNGSANSKKMEPLEFMPYVSPYLKQPPQDPIHFFVLVASLLCFFMKYKVFGWVGVFLAASGLANHKYKGDYSAFSQMLVAVMSTAMVYVQENFPEPQAQA
eukprot:m.3588 g.3588  ORF g.3588 m.3588 type:complete len:123 (-) comp3635_c0_seq1:48-416(-)